MSGGAPERPRIASTVRRPYCRLGDLSGSTERDLFLPPPLRHDVAMLVRHGSLDDLPAMAAVFCRAVLTNEGDRDLLFAHPELTDLEPPADEDVVMVAEVTGRLVGFATARALDDDAFAVTDLFVDPDHMRSGVGRALINAVVAAATEWGRKRIEVEANRNAVAFYGRVGFVEVEEVQLEFGTALRMVMSVPAP